MMIHHKESQIELPEGSSAKDLADHLNLRSPDQALAANINGKAVDLSHSLKENDQIDFIDFESEQGKEIFWHSSAHILAQAILRLYPEAKPTIGPPIKEGFYYDFANLTLSEEDFPKIEKEVQKIIKENFKIKREEIPSRKEALNIWKENPYKCRLIESFEEGSPLSGYHQGEFFDLCRGPHLPNTGKIKAFKILKTSGAYWRGDSQNEMLTRIYAISFPDRTLLKEYLVRIEEAKKRDHKLLGTRLDLFSLNELAPGMPFMHPSGMVIWNQLIQFWRELHQSEGYVEIKTPQLMSKELWELSGHWDFYHENMYLSEIEKRTFAIKPMNCPGCMLFYKTSTHSYRDLPFRVAELGHVHRNEPSGAIHGLFRVRSFHQDDAHIFMKADQIKEEILKVLELVDKSYSAFDLDYKLELSTRPEKSIGTDREWDLALTGLQEALQEWHKPFAINEGDGAFYGPKIDIHITDALNRSWQCGTIQLDMSLPEKFDLTFMDSDGEHKRPIMIHRAIFGSVERFFGILIEHFAGRFPLWLSPRPLRILTVADRHRDYAEKVAQKLTSAGFSVEIDAQSESVNKKVRNAQLMQVNYILCVGDNESDQGMISLRTRENYVYGEISLENFIEKIQKEKQSRMNSPIFKEPI
ncbi:MAG: threonine--tRNA ligase [Simkaniaceae bacterium]